MEYMAAKDSRLQSTLAFFRNKVVKILHWRYIYLLPTIFNDM